MGPGVRIRAAPARDATDGCHADPGQIMNLAIRESLLQQLDHLPPIDQGLELGRGTQVTEEIAAFLDGLETDDCTKEGVL